MEYNPNSRIDTEEWLAADEPERMEAVRRYHRRHKIRLPNDRVHAIIHVIVENQVALGDSYPAKSVLVRLMREGLMAGPQYVPAWAMDLSYLTAFMSYAAFLGESDLSVERRRFDDAVAHAEE